MEQINDFERSFMRMAHEEKQAQAFLAGQLHSLHRDHKQIEGVLRTVDRRAQWCQDEIGYDDD